MGSAQIPHQEDASRRRPVPAYYLLRVTTSLPAPFIDWSAWLICIGAPPTSKRGVWSWSPGQQRKVHCANLVEKAAPDLFSCPRVAQKVETACRSITLLYLISAVCGRL